MFVTQVACHLSKLFDSMAQLKFLEEDGQPTKEAIAMFSKDGEYVTFDKPCMCVGQVSSLCVYVYVCVCTLVTVNILNGKKLLSMFQLAVTDAGMLISMFLTKNIKKELSDAQSTYI